MTREAKGFWLDTDENLKIDNASFDKVNSKQVTIKGMIDTTHKGQDANASNLLQSGSAFVPLIYKSH